MMKHVLSIAGTDPLAEPVPLRIARLFVPTAALP